MDTDGTATARLMEAAADAESVASAEEVTPEEQGDRDENSPTEAITMTSRVPPAALADGQCVDITNVKRGRVRGCSDIHAQSSFRNVLFCLAEFLGLSKPNRHYDIRGVYS